MEEKQKFRQNLLTQGLLGRVYGGGPGKTGEILKLPLRMEEDFLPGRAAGRGRHVWRDYPA